MPAATAWLPRRFPAGTKFVIEGEDTADGRVRIVTRYLVYPDGRQVDLLGAAPRLFGCRARRTAGATRHRRAAQHREDRVALQ
jgi:hypothetical protein